MKKTWKCNGFKIKKVLRKIRVRRLLSLEVKIREKDRETVGMKSKMVKYN